MEGHHNVTGFNCKRCQRPDSADEQMVACDICQEWEHFNCAGVDGSIKDHPYVCSVCKPKKTGTKAKESLKPPEKNDKKSSRTSSKKAGMKATPAPSSVSSATRMAMLEAQMKLIEEQELQQKQDLEAEEELKKREMEAAQRHLEEKRKLLDEENRLRELKLREEKEILEKRKVMRQQSMEKKNELLKQMSECSSKSGSNVDSIEKVSSWLAKQEDLPPHSEAHVQPSMPFPTLTQTAASTSMQPPNAISSSVPGQMSVFATVPNCSMPPARFPTFPPAVQSNVPMLHTPPIPAHSSQSPLIPVSTATVHVSQPVRSVFPPLVQPTALMSALNQQPYPSMIAPTGNEIGQSHPYSQAPASSAVPAVLDTNQLAARQVLGKDLPKFSGRPEDWPLFITSFEQSTLACGYSDVENLIRLKKCLEGNALESVRSKLLLPSSVPHVVQTLRTLYGRPELLIRSLLEKIHQVPTPRCDRLETVIEFGIAVQTLVDHLVAAGQNVHLSNPALMQELVEKLPGTMRMEWAVYKSRLPVATLQSFGDFMSGMVTTASQVSYELPSLDRSGKNDRSRARNKGVIQTHSTGLVAASTPTTSVIKIGKPAKPCACCNREGHRLVECNRFKSLSTDERWKLVEQRSLCRTCLNSHGKWPCRSWKGCEAEGCRHKHHTLLHGAIANSQSGMSASHLSAGQFCMFRIVPVVLHGKGQKLLIFAFIDEGSSETLIEDAVAKQLVAHGPTEPLTLHWTGNVSREESNSQRVQLKIAAKNSESILDLHHVRTVSCLVLPSQTLRYGDMVRRFPHLGGLPIEDYTHVQPKLLIGLNNISLCVPRKLREGGPHDPVAVKCHLGWSIYGGVPASAIRNVAVNFHAAAPSDPDKLLNEQLRDYFSIENNISASMEVDSEEDKRAKALLESTTRRIGQRFETGLLWKTDAIDFPDSYAMALRRLLSLERKLRQDPELGERVIQQIRDYERKGYARKVTEQELASSDTKRTWYLHVGVVVNPKKPNKLRLVWDAAAKVGDVSFNSNLLKGPDLLTPLLAVLSRFRQYPVAVTGDIKEMFHQIRIRKEDQQSQRFLWRENPTEMPQIYVMEVATFGSTCSPASAQFVKNLNAKEYAIQYPRAAAAIHDNHYVDDYLDSFQTIEEAVQVVEEVKFVHSMGGFELRNMLSNSVEVLRRIEQRPGESSKDLLVTRGESTESVLGMRWIPTEDVFTYTFTPRADLQAVLEENHVPTKREVLKVVMSLFDPLGCISFFLVHGKVLIQDTWISKIGWDDPIGDSSLERWKQWTGLFGQLPSLRIPRCYFREPFPRNFDQLQLHVFVDASESAFSSVAYFRLPVGEQIQVAMVASKTKVAPINTISIPRLELKAAVLGTRLLESIRAHHTIPIAESFLWSDSKTVLAWIQSEHRRYHKFVAVRVGEILFSTDVNSWRWVPSKINPADEATKWKNGPNLNSDSSWFHGPSFLQRDENSWPKLLQSLATTQEELRSVHLHRVSFSVVDPSRFSKWNRMLRTTAFVLRYVDNLKRRIERRQPISGILHQEELAKAERFLWKTAQAEAFPEEIAALKTTQGAPEARHCAVSKSSRIYKRWPFLDEEGVLRTRGRIGAAPFVQYEAKYPAILPEKHPITALLVESFHCRFRHANRETITNEMRQRFDIPRLRVLVSRVMRDCTWCRVTKAVPIQPVMGPMPEARLRSFVRPFTHVGLDYFGPVFVKVGRSQAKRWVALFTCLTIRAVHLEVVHSLSTVSCIMAIRRFVSRRGTPAEFYTDNGTCFQGASKELAREIQSRNEAIALTFTSAHTKWHFIPPSAPHMGGAWERLVRSVKAAIGTILDAPRRPDDETLETILFEAEAIVNCRPLTYMPLESADEESLTPNHFLLGSSNGVKISPTEPVPEHATLRNSWKLAQHITDQFWRRWIKEFLPVIARRSKWYEEARDLQVGDLVLAVNGNLRNQWIRGRVIQVFPGRDGRVRQALVKTATGVFRRAAVKLAVLDVEEKCKPDDELVETPDPRHGLRVGVCNDKTHHSGDTATEQQIHFSSVHD